MLFKVNPINYYLGSKNVFTTVAHSDYRERNRSDIPLLR